MNAVGWSFTEHFLGVIEENVSEGFIKGWTLLYSAGDKALIEVLGGEQKAKVSQLTYIHRLMEMGETGPCFVDWRSNFAYVRSPVDRRLWAVHWSVNYEDEWTIGAVYVPHPDLDWRSGSRLFSG